MIKKLKLDKIFSEPESRFLLLCGVKVSGVYMLSTSFLIYTMWIVLKMNNIFFETRGFFGSQVFGEAFFDYALNTINDKLIYIFFFYIILFFLGVYIGKILLRPFKIIGDYCSNKILGEQVSYNPNAFSDYKLLTSFSEMFFAHIEEAVEKKKLTSGFIPQNYAKVKKPIFERVFFFHFLLFISIIGIITISGTIVMTTEIQSQLMDFALKNFKGDEGSASIFLGRQQQIFDSINIAVILITSFCYIALSFHLFSQVGSAVFAFFHTMRSFMRANYSARIHLIGFAYIRNYGRSFNKYLDSLERDFSKSKNKV